MKPRIPDDRIKSRKQFVEHADELTDSESIKAIELIGRVQVKYQYKRNSKENLEALRDEVLTRLAEELSIIAEIDVTPCFYGESPILEVKGKLQSDDIHTHGFDHEKKKWEIDKAHDQGEYFLGEKKSPKE